MLFDLRSLLAKYVIPEEVSEEVSAAVRDKIASIQPKEGKDKVGGPVEILGVGFEKRKLFDAPKGARINYKNKAGPWHKRRMHRLSAKAVCAVAAVGGALVGVDLVNPAAAADLRLRHDDSRIVFGTNQDTWIFRPAASE